jgi:methanethiol S-methyltransferase
MVTCGTGAATVHGNGDASNSTMRRVPLQPRLTCRQKHSRPTPYGETTPMPVIATRGRRSPDIAPIILTLMNATLRVTRAAWLFAWGGAAAFAASLAFFLYSYLVRFGRPAAGSSLVAPIVVDAVLFTVFALHHSLFARPFVKRRLFGVRPGPGPDRSRVRPGSERGLTPPVSPLERPAYVWIASLLFIAVCAAWRSVPGELYRLTGVFATTAYAVLAAGIIMTARGSARLDVLDLAGVRTVSPSRPQKHVPLQTHGVYGFVRHPVYFAWVLMVMGTPHMTMTRLTFAVVSTAYLAIAIPFEERALLDVFGEEYRDYRKRVRWRMIPGVY